VYLENEFAGAKPDFEAALAVEAQGTAASAAAENRFCSVVRPLRFEESAPAFCG
jgi:hypothetical protein